MTAVPQQHWSASLPNTGNDVVLRRAVTDDVSLLFEWRNDPWIVAAGTSRRVVSWDEHTAWFTASLQHPRRLLFVVEVAGIPAGTVRLEGTEPDNAVIAIYLLKRFTGRGLGPKALTEACHQAFADWANLRTITAYVRDDNRASRKAFARTGFLLEQRDDGCPANHVRMVCRRVTPVSVEHVPHNRLTFDETEVNATAAVIRSGYWACGPHTRRLENDLAAHAGVRHAVAVASGSAALRLALCGLGVEPGDKVLVPAYSCVALANAVLACGAEPVAVDVRAEDWNLDPTCVSNAVAEHRPRALIAVHTFGAVASLNEYRQHGVKVIEDCSHAFGAFAGHADATVLSFYATKLLGAGQGGAVLTDSATLADFVRSRRDYADKPPTADGHNDCMTDVEAALASCQLQRLTTSCQQRQRLAEQYHEQLADIAEQTGWFRLPPPQTRIWYRYAVEMRHAEADKIVHHMKQRGVHGDQPVTDWRTSRESCPVATRAYQRLVSLPLYPTLTDEERDTVVRVFLDACLNA